MTPITTVESNGIDNTALLTPEINQDEEILAQSPSILYQRAESSIPDLSTIAIPLLPAGLPQTPGSVEFNKFEFPSSSDYIDTEPGSKLQGNTLGNRRTSLTLQQGGGASLSSSSSTATSTKKSYARHGRMRSSISSISSLHGSKSLGSEAEFESLVDSATFIQPLVTTPLSAQEPWPLNENSSVLLKRPSPRNPAPSWPTYSSGHFSRRSTCYALSEEELRLQEKLQELARSENAKLINASNMSVNDDTPPKPNTANDNLDVNGYSGPSSPYANHANQPPSPISSPIVPFPIYSGFHLSTPGPVSAGNSGLSSPQFIESPAFSRPTHRRQKSAAYTAEMISRKQSPVKEFSTTPHKHRPSSRTILGTHSPKKKQLRTFSAESDLGQIESSFHDNNSVEKVSQMDYEENNSGPINKSGLITGLGLYMEEPYEQASRKPYCRTSKSNKSGTSRNPSRISSGNNDNSDGGSEFLYRGKVEKKSMELPRRSITPPIPADVRGNIYSWKMSGDILESFLCFSESRLSILDLLKSNWRTLSDPNNLKLSSISNIRILPPYDMLITIKNSIPKFIKGIFKSCKNAILGIPKFIFRLCIASINSSILVIQVSTIISFVGLVSSVQFVFSSLGFVFYRYTKPPNSQRSDQLVELSDADNDDEEEEEEEEEEDDEDGADEDAGNDSLIYHGKEF